MTLTERDVARLMEAADTLSTQAHHRLMRMEGSRHPCDVDGCVLSQEEHHRIAYGLIAENRELRRRVADLENGRAKSEEAS